MKRDKFDLILKSFKEASQEVYREGEKADFQSIIATEIQVKNLQFESADFFRFQNLHH